MSENVDEKNRGEIAVDQQVEDLDALVEGIEIATPTRGGLLSRDSPAGGIGVGIGFEAVRATVVATTSGPVPVMCSSDATMATP